MKIAGINSQTDANGDLVEAVATATKEQIARFPVKRKLGEENGKETWIVSLVSSEPFIIKEKRPKRRAGDQAYLNK